MAQVSFEIKPHTDEELGSYRAIFIDGKLFDWGLDEESLNRAASFTGNDAVLRKAMHGDIRKYFLDCLEQYIGRRPTMKEVNTAIEAGYIEC